MELKNINNIFFLGIGGIGMSALARYFHSASVSVSGYDKTPTALTSALQQEGINIGFTDDPAILPNDCQLVVVTPAVPVSTKLYQAIQAKGIPMLKRAKVLGMISREIPTIAVAGTHGKTTISTMIAHIMKTAGIQFTAFLGGISADYKTNYLGSTNPEWMVVEADEFDRSFLQLSPTIAVISSMDTDHLDIYGSAESMIEAFDMFARRVHPDGKLVMKNGLKLTQGYLAQAFTYHLSGTADIYTEEVRVENNSSFASIRGLLSIEDLQPGLPGRHNLENALAAMAVAHFIGIDNDTISSAIESFSGVKRRFEIIFKDSESIYIDDYAHHPEELRACINAARELFPGKKITGIFQPHLFTRTRDLAEEFALSLALLDELILMEIYPARELPIEGITSSWLLDLVPMKDKRVAEAEEIQELISGQNIEVLLTMGAGDIDRLVEPLKNIFTYRDK